MSGPSIRRAVAVLAAAVLTTALAGSALAADPEPAAKKRIVKCAGVVATKVGTAKADRIVGTNKRDVIAGLGGNDLILGLGGNDLICGGTGHDRVFGGPGRDKLLGQAGRDRLHGGTARDRLFGGAHGDFLFGQGGPDLLLGGPGNDRLVGGPGIDTCYQNSGQGAVLQCELPVAAPAPLAPTGPTLHDLTGIHAIAYSDIDGLEGYSTDDQLIAKLVDDGNGVPGSGDKVVMGMYPLDLTPTAFGTWGITEHAVAFANPSLGRISANVGPGLSIVWDDISSASNSGRDYFYEVDTNNLPAPTEFTDVHESGSEKDRIAIDPGSPSQPQGGWLSDSEDRLVDNTHLDVEVLYTP